MSIYETSITNPKKQLEFYKQLSEQLQQENKILKENSENNDKVVDKVNWENMLLKKENKQLQERIEYLERSNNRREDTILEQRQRLNDLEDNWNKLKEWVKNNIKYWEKEEKNWIEMGIAKVGGEANNKIIFKMILDIVEELEQGSDSK